MVIADSLQVSADALLSDEQITIKDIDLLKKFEAIQNIEGVSKNMILEFLDLAIRDAKAKQAYAWLWSHLLLVKLVTGK